MYPLLFWIMNCETSMSIILIFCFGAAAAVQCWWDHTSWVSIRYNMCTGGICCFEVALLEGFKNDISATLEDQCFSSFKIVNHRMSCYNCELLLDVVWWKVGKGQSYYSTIFRRHIQKGVSQKGANAHQPTLCKHLIKQKSRALWEFGLCASLKKSFVP